MNCRWSVECPQLTHLRMRRTKANIMGLYGQWLLLSLPRVHVGQAPNTTTEPQMRRPNSTIIQLQYATFKTLSSFVY